MKSDVPEYQRISLAFFHGCFLTCLSSFPIIILTFLVWSDISVCPNIIKPHFSLKNQGFLQKFILHKKGRKPFFHAHKTNFHPKNSTSDDTASMALFYSEILCAYFVLSKRIVNISLFPLKEPEYLSFIRLLKTGNRYLFCPRTVNGHV